jgi:hypothetical protein
MPLSLAAFLNLDPPWEDLGFSIHLGNWVLCSSQYLGHLPVTGKGYRALICERTAELAKRASRARQRIKASLAFRSTSRAWANSPLSRAARASSSAWAKSASCWWCAISRMRASQISNGVTGQVPGGISFTDSDLPREGKRCVVAACTGIGALDAPC